eukprot:TRINITY_DN5283_c0_g1_i2.p1 TRINITY_DN5283_c0_g1~~TRINITY_DN5283_c0_g1_i2.p1  ORF type:complete len:327 (-),score=34.02 TRINITY_DN5283_c0_g1_i2:253-1089(-)
MGEAQVESAPNDSDDQQEHVDVRYIEPVTQEQSSALGKSDAQPSSSSSLALTTLLKHYGMPSLSMPSPSPEETCVFREVPSKEPFQRGSKSKQRGMPSSSLPPNPPEGGWVFHETLWGKPFQRGQHGMPSSSQPPASPDGTWISHETLWGKPFQRGQHGMPSSSQPPASPDGTWIFHETLWGKPFQRGQHGRPSSSQPPASPDGTWIFHETLWGKPFQHGSVDAQPKPKMSTQQSGAPAPAADVKKPRTRRRGRKIMYFSSPDQAFDAICNSNEFRIQ